VDLPMTKNQNGGKKTFLVSRRHLLGLCNEFWIIELKLLNYLVELHDRNLN
jgi:hypothetical protein